jgi:uncharacterized membrane protein YagU involved in acid resistance
MTPTAQASPPPAGASNTCPFAGVIAGLVAGSAYLAAQVAFSGTLQDASFLAPLQRIAAILVGTDDLPPATEFSMTILGMALLIHFSLAVVFGRFVDLAVRHRTGAPALVRGVGVAVLLYGVNYFLIAPSTFPWFEENRGLTTLVDHMLFGAVCAAVYVQVRRARPQWVA